MKKVALLLISVVLFSCAESKEEKLVSDYEQRIGSTKTDLNLKFKKFDFIKDYFAKDSLSVLKEYFEAMKMEKIAFLQVGIDDSKESIKMIEGLNMDGYAQDGIIYGYKKSLERNQSAIDLYNGDCKGTFLEPVLVKIEAFESNPDSIIAKEYDVTYTILNPMLNNVKQTLSKTYYLNSDKTEILKTESK